jgi:hypothetical protein
MKPSRFRRAPLTFIAAAIVVALAVHGAAACTRTLYVGADNTVITGRNMDWMEDMASNLWVFPAGMRRDGAAGPRSIRWTSRYGSVIVSGYEAGTTDGMNERGLVANLLYLAEADYGKPDDKKPFLSVAAWAQYVLDNYASVGEAVNALRQEPYQMLAPRLPNGDAAALHLSISDATGDSAIFEYVDGKLVIHHGKQYVVMTNSPIYEKQLAPNEYWGKHRWHGVPARHLSRRRSLCARIVPARCGSEETRPQLYQGRSGSILRVPGGGGRIERPAGGECAAGHHDAGRAQYRINAVANRFGSEELDLLL